MWAIIVHEAFANDVPQRSEHNVLSDIAEFPYMCSFLSGSEARVQINRCYISAKRRKHSTFQHSRLTLYLMITAKSLQLTVFQSLRVDSTQRIWKLSSANDRQGVSRLLWRYGASNAVTMILDVETA